jgi:hypothetical protein
MHFGVMHFRLFAFGFLTSVVLTRSFLLFAIGLLLGNDAANTTFSLLSTMFDGAGLHC